MAKKNDYFKNGGTGKKKKKHVVLIIFLVLLAAILIAAGVFVWYGYRTMKKMSDNQTVNIIPAPEELPTVTAAPADLVPVENPDELDLTEDYDPEIDPEDIKFVDIFQKEAIDKDIINILLLGNDERNSIDHGRSDTMMLLSFNKKQRSLKLVSFLRDTWIYIPGRNTWNRLNTAFRFGGVGLAVNTINTNFGLDIQHYMLVNFDALKDIVDIVGGIDLQLSVREIEFINNMSHSTPLPVTAGWHHLNGAQTLAHARNRKIGNGDWSRTERQRNVMYALFNKIKNESNAASLMNLVNTLSAHVQTNLSPAEMTSLAIDVVFGGSLDLANRSVPFEGTWNYAWEGSMAVIHIDVAKNKALLHKYLYG